jgi:hypothetical protein
MPDKDDNSKFSDKQVLLINSSLDKPETGGVTAHIWDQHGTYAPYMGHLS